MVNGLRMHALLGKNARLQNGVRWVKKKFKTPIWKKTVSLVIQKKSIEYYAIVGAITCYHQEVPASVN